MSKKIIYYCDQEDKFQMLYCGSPKCTCNTISPKVKKRIREKEKQNKIKTN